MENNQKIITPQLKFTLIFIIWLILALIFVVSCRSDRKPEPLGRPVVLNIIHYVNGELAAKTFFSGKLEKLEVSLHERISCK